MILMGEIMRRKFLRSWFSVVAFVFAASYAAAQGVKAPAPPELKSKPIPRAADGKPDLTGFWAEWRRVTALEGSGKLYAAREKEIAASRPRPSREPMALTEWAQERLTYNQDPLFKEPGGRVRNELDPSSHCFPSGPARLAPPFQIFQIPSQVWMIYQENTEVRQIFTDGRSFPPAEEMEVTWNGYSIGKWDGDALVVETIGMREETLLDAAGHVHGPDLKITERIQRIAYDVLEIERTYTDPKALMKPYKTVATYPLAPADWDLFEDIKCEYKFEKGLWFGEGPSGL